jgi:hypothetical protein
MSLQGINGTHLCNLRARGQVGQRRDHKLMGPQLAKNL